MHFIQIWFFSRFVKKEIIILYLLHNLKNNTKYLQDIADWRELK